MTQPGFEDVVLKKLEQIQSDVSELKSDMKEVKTRLSSVEDGLSDFRDEFHAETRASRTLLNQAFEHISDHLISSGTSDFVPKSRYPRVK